MTLVMSNMWAAETNHGQGPATPWSNWGGYSYWVANTVKTVEAAHHVDYWEIQNEPGAPGYYNASDWNNLTPQDLLWQYLIAYRAIKSVDPNAQIIGPSLSHFADYPGQYNGHELDLVTFLDFAAANNMKLAAISWHEIDDSLGPNPHDWGLLPQNIEDHVAEVRQLIAQRPALGSPQISINEYGHHMDSAIPGWNVGYLAALERSQAGAASRACWEDQTPQNTMYVDCWSPTLDALFGLDGISRRANYWVYQTYANMTGSRFTVSSSDDTVSGLAAAGGGTKTVQALIGRHFSCLGGTNNNCWQPSGWVPGPIKMSLTIKIPWGVSVAQVTVARIPATWQLVTAPTTTFQGSVPVTNGVATLQVPTVADGDAYTISVSG
jgi:hypothetical protein